MYSPMAFCTTSSATTMSTRAPAVPDSSTSCVRAREIRARPGRGAAERPRAVGRVPREAGRDHLAGRRRELRPAEELDDLVPVDREIDGLPRLELVERLDVEVERDVPDGGQLVLVQLRRVAALQLGQPVGRDVVDDPVGLVALDLGDLGLGAQPEALHDAIDVAVRLGGRRPDLEVRVAAQDELPGRGVGRPVVRAGAGEARDVRADLLGTRARRQQRGGRQRELLRPVGCRAA